MPGNYFSLKCKMHKNVLQHGSSDVLCLNGIIIMTTKFIIWTFCLIDYTTAPSGFHLAYFFLIRVMIINGFTSMSYQPAQQKVNVARTDLLIIRRRDGCHVTLNGCDSTKPAKVDLANDLQTAQSFKGKQVRDQRVAFKSRGGVFTTDWFRPRRCRALKLGIGGPRN